jgi:hypothetical protein
MFYRSRQKEGAGVKYSHLDITLLTVNGAVSLLLLILSVYHFTHHGLTSGIIELLLAIILIAINLLIA